MIFKLLNLLVLDSGSIPWIVIGVVVGVALIVTSILLLNHFVFRKHKAKKTLNDSKRKYEYLHSILIGKDFQILQRIDQISRTNIIYIDIHTANFKKFKEIRDVSDKMFGDIIKQLEKYYMDNQITKFFELYREKAALLKTYEANLSSFHDELMDIIRPEEEAREEILNLKEKFRELKSLYNSKEYDLFVISKSFKTVFEKIEDEFQKYDNYIENASYEEAKELLPELNGVISYLIKNINVLPSLINQVSNDLPQEIIKLKDKNKDMILNGYPLQNINFNGQLDNIEKTLNSAKSELNKINVKRVNRYISEIKEMIENINNSFDNEISSKLEFDNKINTALKNYANLNKAFMNLSNYLEKIEKYYIVEKDKIDFFDELNNKMDEVNKNKRRLDIYLHSKDATPFSMLKEKICELEDGTNKVNEDYNYFVNYIESLKKDSEMIFKNLKEKYNLFKKYENKLMEIKNNNFVEEMNTRFNDGYYFLDEIFSRTQIIPINVKELKEFNEKLEEVSNKIFISIDEMINDKNKTEENILLMNRDRFKFSDINSLLSQVENLYFNGDYIKSFEMSSSVLNTLRQKSEKVE